MRLNELMSTYRTDSVSNFAKLEYCTRRYYVRLMAQIERDHGEQHYIEARPDGCKTTRVLPVAIQAPKYRPRRRFCGHLSRYGSRPPSVA